MPFIEALNITTCVSSCCCFFHWGSFGACLRGTKIILSFASNLFASFCPPNLPSNVFLWLTVLNWLLHNCIELLLLFQMLPFHICISKIYKQAPTLRQHIVQPVYLHSSISVLKLILMSSPSIYRGTVFATFKWLFKWRKYNLYLFSCCLLGIRPLKLSVTFLIVLYYFYSFRLEKEYTTIKTKEMEEQVEIKVREPL